MSNTHESIGELAWHDFASQKQLEFQKSGDKLVVLYNPNDDGQYVKAPTNDPAFYVAKYPQTHRR
jgi:hypothetical protein